MIQQILFPFDLSAQGVLAAAFVRALARQLGASVTVLSVVPLNLAIMPEGMGEDITSWKRSLQSRVDHALTTELAGVPVTRITDAGDPATCITRVAHDAGIDLIMMPTHGLGVFRALLVGSATSKVLHDATCPVWTAAHSEQHAPGGVPKTVLCAVDAEPGSDALLRWAADFCARVGATLEVLHVVVPAADWSAVGGDRTLEEQWRRDAHQQIAAMQAAGGVQAPLRVAIGDVVRTVAEHARATKADLVIIGRGSLPTAMGRLRTHAYGIVQRSPCPVLSV